MIQRRAASLRSTLLIPLLWLWLVPAVVATLSAFWLAGLAAQNAFDRVLKDDALALAAEVRWEADGPVFRLDPSGAASLVFDSMAPSRFTVRTASGRVLVGNAPLNLPPHTDRAAADGSVFYESQTPWGPLRTVALRVNSPAGSEVVWVIVGEAESKRAGISRELASAIFLPAAGVGFVLVPLLFLGIGRGLAPARELVAAVTSRGIDDLSPIPVGDVPQELRGLVERLNDLFARLSEAIAHERRFIADAAHQLRTPTAGIKLLAEDLMQGYHRAPQSPPDGEVLAELHAAAVRTSDLVRQLLLLARAERDPSLIERAPLDLAALARQVVAHWAQSPAAQGRDLGPDADLAGQPPCWVESNATLIEEALGNLVDNALRYGGPTVRVGLQAGPEAALLSVTDDGSPLDDAARVHLFDPFWRGSGALAGGTGLGLAIAQRTIRSLGGELSFEARPLADGNCFRIRLPRPQPGTADAARPPPVH